MAADQPRLHHDVHITTPPETPHEIPGVIGDAAQITGVDKDEKDMAIGEAIEEAIVDIHVENIELENDLCNNPTESPTAQD